MPSLAVDAEAPVAGRRCSAERVRSSSLVCRRRAHRRSRSRRETRRPACAYPLLDARDVIEPRPKPVVPRTRARCRCGNDAGTAAPDRWQLLASALASCDRENCIAGLVCKERARLEYCEGEWGKRRNAPPAPRAATRVSARDIPAPQRTTPAPTDATRTTRRRTAPGRRRCRSAVVLERELDARAVGDDLAAFHLHVELGDFRDAQVAQRLAAAVTAFLAASSHETLLVPMTSVTRYTPSLRAFFAMCFLLEVSPARGRCLGRVHNTRAGTGSPARGRGDRARPHANVRALLD